MNPPATPTAARFDAAARAGAPAKARSCIETSIDALDITVLEGGGKAVGDWAREHGFLLPPDSPEVLDFYAKRSPIFMAARFNGERAAARGSAVGDGTPIHLTIPTPNPWVPLRILALGQHPDAIVQADVFLLTEQRPALLARGQQRGLRPQPLGGRVGRRCSTDLRTRQGHGVGAVVDVAEPPEDRHPRARAQVRPGGRRGRRARRRRGPRACPRRCCRPSSPRPTSTARSSSACSWRPGSCWWAPTWRVARARSTGPVTA